MMTLRYMEHLCYDVYYQIHGICSLFGIHTEACHAQGVLQAYFQAKQLTKLLE